MENERTNDQGMARELYAEVQEAYQRLPDYRRAYGLLNRAFQKCLDDKTGFAGVRFNGAFAKTDYLLKEHGAPRYLRGSVNDARVRFRQMRSLSDADCKANFDADFQAVCLFVQLIYQEPVPADLEARFQKVGRKKRGKLTAEYLRIIVNRWDDTYLYAQADMEGGDEVKVFYGGKSEWAVYKDWDWSYLKDILVVGCQLNIVRPKELEGVLYPELFIWEPDFLVDISAIANCFESYGVSPLNHLLQKIKPSACTQPILLGQLASQFLDESLYYYPKECTYGESVKRFFADNALNLLTTDVDKEFHNQAQDQKRNIQDTLRSKLPEMLKADGIRFDASEIMVEPSFFSEMLGLQGRMDFLQLGQKVLIEQKSGKAQYPETDPPKQQDRHYVQLLLYMLLIRYNYRAVYERNDYKLFAFLLYSKYTKGLLPLGFAPELMFDAIKIRNGMVAAEYDYSRGGLDILTSLSADGLNVNHIRGTLWERFVKPQIEELLSPIHRASDLERAYYLRFLRFIQTEHIVAKIGNQTKENAGFADKWLCSLEDKLLSGNIFYDLELLSPKMPGSQTAEPMNSQAVERVELGFGEKPDFEVSNFRTGDIVILYPYTEGEEPDARRTMVFRATIETIATDKIVLSLRATQVDARVFWWGGKRKWAIEHDFFESSFSGLYRGMHAFLSAPQDRKDLLLFQRHPRVDETKTLLNDYGDFNELALRVKQAEDLFLIWGPPGTGKTSYGLLNTLKEELASNEGNVLLLSYTHRAVDEICGKLMDCGIDFIRFGGKLSCDERCRPFLLDTKVQACGRLDELKAIIGRTRVIVGTVASLNGHIDLFRLKQFGLAIVDESSQILEPHLMGLLSATAEDGSPAIKKWVLIGDHKQLPAVVQQAVEESAVDDDVLHAVHLTNCRNSLFERLLKQYRDDPTVTYMLTRQGRMHEEIALFPNRAFYGGKLSVVPLPHQNCPLPPACGKNGLTDLLTSYRVGFVAIHDASESVSDKVNSSEARAIAATVLKIYEMNPQQFSAQKTVGVIVPYRNQISEVKRCLAEYGIEALLGITVDTVERFQGSQRDYILYGFTVQKHYQLSFLTSSAFEEEDGSVVDRKLNVAMTRAREHLLLFGNPALLSRNNVFLKLIEFIKSKHGYFTAERLYG